MSLIRRKKNPEILFVTCMECGNHFQRISHTHLARCSGITLNEYKTKYPEAMMELPSVGIKKSLATKGFSYAHRYGEEKAKLMKAQKSKSTKNTWENNPVRLAQRQEVLERELIKLNAPSLIGRKRGPNAFMPTEKICKHCGISFMHNAPDRQGVFCSHDCYLQNRRLASENYKIKAFAHYDNVCSECGEREKRLVVHHKNTNRLDNDLDNLCIVCHRCHRKIHELCKESEIGFKLSAIKSGMINILQGLRVEMSDENFKDTPTRVAKAYEEIFEGLLPSSIDELEKSLCTTFPSSYNEMIVVTDIECWSMCPHHFLPVKYNISLGYIPNDKVLGISKLPRLVILLAKRPVLQEQLTQDIVDYLEKHTSPKGVIVRVSGDHMCMQMRGVKARDSKTITSAVSGGFSDNASTRSEFYSLITLK